MGISRETLASGNVLRYLVKLFNDNGTEENFISVLRCLRDSKVWVPCSMKMSDADSQKFSGASVGDVVQSTNDISLTPDILANGDNLFFPTFSGIEQMGEEYSSRFSKIELHFLDCISMAREKEGLSGIVLDAFTQPIIIAEEIFSFIEQLPSEIEE